MRCAENRRLGVKRQQAGAETNGMGRRLLHALAAACTCAGLVAPPARAARELGIATRPYVVDAAAGTQQALAPLRRFSGDQRLSWAFDGGALLTTQDRRVPNDRFTRTLVRAPAAGGAMTDVTSVDCAADQAILSPAGDRIAELSYGPFTRPGSSRDIRVGPDDLVLRDLAGRVLARVRGAISRGDVRFSADGRRLAVPVGNTHLEHWRIRVLDTATGAQVGVVRTPDMPDVGVQAFSPDGGAIAFATMTGLRFYVADVATGAVRALGPGRSRTQGDLVDEVAWAPAGDERFAALLHDGSVRVAGADGILGALIAPPGGGRSAGANDLSWSPDGARLAWASARFDRNNVRNAAIVLADPAIGAARALVGVPHGLLSDLGWSPDGSRLAYLLEARSPWE